MTKPDHDQQHGELDYLPVPADHSHESGPRKTPLHHHVSCAAITPPATPPVPRPADEQEEQRQRQHQPQESHTHFPSGTTTDTTSTTITTPCDDTCSLAYSQTSTTHSSRREYMDSLVPPSRDEFDKIAEVQRTREEEIKRNRPRRRSMHSQLSHETSHASQDAASATAPATAPAPAAAPADAEAGRPRSDSEAFNRAATLIQRNYRGYRVRREMRGFGLDASTRWVSAIDELQFRELNRPRAKSSVGSAGTPVVAAAVAGGDQHSVLSRDEDGGMGRATARENWKKAATIARRAGHDDVDSDSDDTPASSDSEESPQQRAERRKRREEGIARRKKDSKMMGLQYFLEMVDLKHRYGSNLRVYHEEWKRSDTNENFFYWLDYGSGKNLEMEACPRDRLEREQVRYLSREERQYYLVQVDADGRLCWAKNGARIDTTEAYKDSIHGIVPADDPTPAWQQGQWQEEVAAAAVDDSRSESSVESALEADRAAKYATPEYDNATGVKKVSHISAATVFNKLLRKSVKKNTWIFVADTSFRLYVGIKSSGAFQHSSFLQGSRISAAGLIKIKNGRLSSLSPLSGHYRPPASNFRAFVKNLKEEGVDTTHVSISKSYAVLVGLEVYVKSRRKGKQTLEKITHKKDKIVAPEEFRRREEEAIDKSESAAREREVLEKEAEEREENRAAVKLMRKLNLAPQVPEGQRGGDEGRDEGAPVMDTLAEERTREDRDGNAAPPSRA
ncbi:IQ domain-containing protein IQM6 [Colletotrichum chlorophyti]|uniref:IQ domain-containing protein IQM6 n=1 Tax=Colletotrichum chlorophyti TaxID=708187 RepID=A0A1Q8RBH1_9PEZI|nr:IQ domain-containing protein IQM6 [Colletotrichum chlorophyti]